MFSSFSRRSENLHEQYTNYCAKKLNLDVITDRTTQNSLGMKRRLPSPVKILTKKSLTCEEQLSEEVNILQDNIIEIEAKAAHRELELQHEINNVRDLLNQYKFTVDRINYNNLQFKFYNAFESYELFKAVLNYLKPVAHSLIYWSSNTNIKDIYYYTVLINYTLQAGVLYIDCIYRNIHRYSYFLYNSICNVLIL